VSPSRVRDRVSRLPLRVRLVAGFSATMFVVLTAAGAFVYWRVQFALDRQLNGDLTTEARLVAPYVRPDGSVGPGVASVAGGELYQVLDARGRLLTASPAMPQHALLSAPRTSQALQSPLFRNIGDLLPTTKDPLRIYASALPHASQQRAALLVVAVRRDHRDEALLELLAQLSLAGLGALLVTAVVGDLLARFALRPVERYRIRAADIAAGASGVRLDVPPGRDDEVTRLGDTLNDMLEALEEAVERERRFVDDASHELRTPLTLLTTRLQLARRRQRTVAEHEAILAEIETDVVRLVQLAEHLLDVGTDRRVDDGGCDLGAVVGAEVERRNTLARATRGAPPIRASLQEAPVALSEAAVGQLVVNLLENAARYGAPPVTVTVDTVDGGLARLAVSDAGPGMPPELLDTATRRFTRAETSRTREGFGLGLSLVENVVTRARGELRLCCGGHHARHGARLDVPCDHGDQMTVTVLLPAA